MEITTIITPGGQVYKLEHTEFTRTHDGILRVAGHMNPDKYDYENLPALPSKQPPSDAE